MPFVRHVILNEPQKCKYETFSLSSHKAGKNKKIQYKINKFVNNFAILSKMFVKKTTTFSKEFTNNIQSYRKPKNPSDGLNGEQSVDTPQGLPQGKV